MKNIQRNKLKFQNKEAALTKFHGLARWKFLLRLKNFKPLLEVLIDGFEQTVIEKLKEHGLDKNPLTFEKFNRICETENIVLTRIKRTKLDADIYGQYKADKDMQIIWLKDSLKGKRLLYIAAHELAHHFLHREMMLQGLLRNPIHLQLAIGMTKELFFAEIEADLLACLMLTTGGEK